eukprot:gene11170-3228_t
MGWLLICHTGCGNYSSTYASCMMQVCTDALDAVRLDLCDLDPSDVDWKDRFYQIALRAVVSLENNPKTSAGQGSHLSMDEIVELESCVMNEKQELGCVSCVTECRNPCLLAFKVLLQARETWPLGRVPPKILSASGANKFAHKCGLGDESAQTFLVTEAKLAICRKWKISLEKELAKTHQYKRSKAGVLTDGKNHYKQRELTSKGQESMPHDTIGLVGIHSSGAAIAVVSSGGHTIKEPGRIGLAGLPGAGVWVTPKAETTNEQRATVTTGWV